MRCARSPPRAVNDASGVSRKAEAQHPRRGIGLVLRDPPDRFSGGPHSRPEGPSRAWGVARVILPAGRQASKECKNRRNWQGNHDDGPALLRRRRPAHASRGDHPLPRRPALLSREAAMNYPEMQRDILELFVEASSRQRSHERSLVGCGFAWRRQRRGELWRSQSAERREAMQAHNAALLAVLRTTGPRVEVGVCDACGGRVERREGTGRWQHVGVQRCPARGPQWPALDGAVGRITGSTPVAL